MRIRLRNSAVFNTPDMAIASRNCISITEDDIDATISNVVVNSSGIGVVIKVFIASSIGEIGISD